MKTWFAAGLVVLALGANPAQANQLSAEDQKLYRSAFDSAHQERFDAALATAAKAHDKLLAKVLQWLDYTHADSSASFADITGFIRANPTWPQIATLQRRAEESITVGTPDAALLEWFAVYPPQTVDGALAYGKALMGTGDNDKAEKVVRHAWITGDFGPIQEHEFLANFQDMLRDEDQVARLDRLLWERQESAARQQMPRADAGYQQVAQARLALASGATNAEDLAGRVPDEYKDNPGLVYDMLRFRRQHDMDDQAVALLDHPAHDKVHPELWWVERAVLARRALQRGDAPLAYRIANVHGKIEGSRYADAEWLAGWIALRFLSDRDAALQHFERLYEHVNTPQSRSRGAYWAGRTAEAMGQGDDAARWYGLAAAHGTTFYGQLAAGRLQGEHKWVLPPEPQPTAEDLRDFERHELVRAARMLAEIKESDLIRPFMLRMDALAHTPGERALAAHLGTSLGRPDVAVAVAKHAEREGVPLVTSGYPIPAVTATEKPERALVLGVIRQESAFHFEAVSSVGARGLMQLMPTTAAKVAKAMNVVFKKKDALADALTSDPGLNVKIGSAYLGELLDDFNGSYILSVAAYNAGPARVKKWLREMGDPRTPDVDPVDWIESIPYSETRNYVQRVLEGAQVYRGRLGKTELVLEKDLRR